MYNIFFGVICLVGGLSGKLTLIGTASSPALAGVGMGLIVWGAYQEYQKRKAR